MAIDEPGSAPTSCTVTFGRSSFVGRSLAAALLNSGGWTVRIADLLPPADDDPVLSGPIRSGRAGYFLVDFSDRDQLRSAVAGSAVVFHVDPVGAAPLPPAPETDFPRLHALAVGGTKNLIAACRQSGVRRLVYTGSADVVFDGMHDVCGGDESLPYPDKFADAVNELRAQVEIMVLNANGRDRLLTCALRPSNPFGPGDSHLVPFLMGIARSGDAQFIIGSGRTMCDFTYMENVAHANICAEQALRSESTSVAGKPFFVTNREPVELWEFLSNILEGLGYQRPRIYIPVKLALPYAMLVKQVRRMLSLSTISSPFLTPATIYTLSCTRTFDCSKAKGLLGYSPIVPLEDGIRLTVESFSQSAKDASHVAYSSKRDFAGPSKAVELLAGGKVAAILLWRDERRTFTYLLALFLLFYWFLLSGRSFISSSAKMLLLISVILFVHGILPPSMFGFTLEKMSPSYFGVPESAVRHSFMALASLWNKGICTFKLLAQGDDWSVFFKAAGLLYLLKMLSPLPLPILVGTGLVLLFSIFIIYEQYEEKVDKLIMTAAVGIINLKETAITKLPSSLKM